MKNETKNIEDSKKLEEVINALGMSANSLSVKLEYKSAASVYHVVNGINKLSEGMIDRIVDYIPNVSLNYLKYGKLPILLADDDLNRQMSLLNKGVPNMGNDFHSFKRLMEVPERLDRIEEMLKELLSK
jgi:hypothetical protein